MSSSRPEYYFVSVDEYLAGEEVSNVRHEYVNGRVYAMSGVSDKHNEITFDVASLLKNHLRGTPFETFLLDVKVEAKSAKENQPKYYYPDVFVTSEQEDYGAFALVKREPKLVIEILSPSSWRVDEGEKLRNYSEIPSVEEVVLIAQDWPEVIVHRRSEGWKPVVNILPEDLIRFASVRLEVALGKIYASILFNKGDARPWYLQGIREDV